MSRIQQIRPHAHCIRGPRHVSVGDPAQAGFARRRALLAMAVGAVAVRLGDRRGAPRRQELPAAQESAAGRDGQEDRGHRVLLLRLPALRRARAELSRGSKTLPADVQFRRVPVMFQERWVTLGKIYYTLEALGEDADCRRRSSPRSTAEGQTCGRTRRSSTGRRARDSTARRSRTCTTRSRSAARSTAREAARADLQDPVGADGHRRRQVRHAIGQSARTRSCRRRSTR